MSRNWRSVAVENEVSKCAVGLRDINQ
jgi:hypothetical protein